MYKQCNQHETRPLTFDLHRVQIHKFLTLEFGSQSARIFQINRLLVTQILAGGS